MNKLQERIKELKKKIDNNFQEMEELRKQEKVQSEEFDELHEDSLFCDGALYGIKFAQEEILKIIEKWMKNNINYDKESDHIPVLHWSDWEDLKRQIKGERNE